MSGLINLKQSLIDEDRKRVESFNRPPGAKSGARDEAIAGFSGKARLYSAKKLEREKGMSWNRTRIFWKVFSKRNLARQFPRLLRTPARLQISFSMTTLASEKSRKSRENLRKMLSCGDWSFRLVPGRNSRSSPQVSA